MLHSFTVPRCHVEGFRRESRSLIVLSARRRRDEARCPDCNRLSNTVHGYYERHPANLPLSGRRVRLDLRLRCYVCINPGCRRQTFAKRLPMLLAPRSRRTRWLAQAQTQIGMALGGEAGSRLARRLCMPTSGDTLLRLIRATPVAAAGTPAIIGVDDWVVRKRARHGTIIVDLEHRRPIDLLPERDAQTLAAWLQVRPEISLVTRDRWAEYRRAIIAGAPSAIQVVDRWHLLCNARQMAERWAAGAYARLQRLPPVVILESPVAGRTEACVRIRSTGEVATGGRVWFQVTTRRFGDMDFNDLVRCNTENCELLSGHSAKKYRWCAAKGVAAPVLRRLHSKQVRAEAAAAPKRAEEKRSLVKFRSACVRASRPEYDARRRAKEFRIETRS